MKNPLKRRRTASAAAPPPNAPLRVLSVASELFPLVKTGGLADVAGALPPALDALGIEMHTLLPAYPALRDLAAAAEPAWSDPDFFGGPARLIAAQHAGLRLFLLDAPHLYDRPGNPYVDASGRDWPDNPQRFAALAFAAAVLARGAAGFRPDIVHAHDWQAALTPAYLALDGRPRPPTVMTVHNLAFQGNMPASLLATLRLPAAAFTPDGVEFHGQIGMLKAGLRYADRITTVSPTYAAEICTPEGGMGLDGLLRARAGRLTGILNGIDTKIWDPAADPFLPAAFDAENPAPRSLAKVALQRRFGLKPGVNTLLFGVVSRLSHQKGLDVLLATLPALLGHDAQLALLGAGDADLQAAFQQAARAHPGRIGVILGYDEALAHSVQGGSDAILVPSRFEPCGLTQLCALRYGAIPVVSRVGGLADTVIDANVAARAAGVATGIQFAPVTPAALSAALARTVALWQNSAEWSAMQGRAMRSQVGWAAPARAYAALYAELAASPAPPSPTA